MRIELRVPDIGDFRDVPVIELPVRVGDTVALDEPVATLESDKATLDIPATAAGRIAEIRVKVGDRVSEGSLIALIEAEEAAEPAPDGPEARATAGPDDRGPAMALDARSARADRPADAAAPAPSPAPAAGDDARPALPTHASPAIRRLARELGVDIARVSGTGPKGRITREDVQAHVRAALAAAPAPSGIAGLGLPPWPKVDHARFGPVEREPLSRIRRLSGPALARNAVLIPHVTSFDRADVTELEAFRKRVNAEGQGPKLTLVAFAVKAAVLALRAFPHFNASLEGEEIVIKRYYNIGIAADTPGGLVVPVIRAADAKGITAIAEEMARLAAEARAGRLGPADMQGATFTISSLGGVGGTGFTPIINAPEVAILGLSRATIEPVWDGETFRPRLMLPLALSWDHRVVDGVAASRFLGHLAASLADHGRLAL